MVRSPGESGRDSAEPSADGGEAPVPKNSKRGRPKGSKDGPRAPDAPPRGRPRKERKPLGRPKGSKSKTERSESVEGTPVTVLVEKRSVGRPKGSKDKTSRTPRSNSKSNSKSKQTATSGISGAQRESVGTQVGDGGPFGAGGDGSGEFDEGDSPDQTWEGNDVDGEYTGYVPEFDGDQYGGAPAPSAVGVPIALQGYHPTTGYGTSSTHVPPTSQMLYPLDGGLRQFYGFPLHPPRVLPAAAGGPSSQRIPWTNSNATPSNRASQLPGHAQSTSQNGNSSGRSKRRRTESGYVRWNLPPSTVPVAVASIPTSTPIQNDAASGVMPAFSAKMAMCHVEVNKLRSGVQTLHATLTALEAILGDQYSASDWIGLLDVPNAEESSDGRRPPATSDGRTTSVLSNQDSLPTSSRKRGRGSIASAGASGITSSVGVEVPGVTGLQNGRTQKGGLRQDVVEGIDEQASHSMNPQAEGRADFPNPPLHQSETQSTTASNVTGPLASLPFDDPEFQNALLDFLNKWNSTPRNPIAPSKSTPRNSTITNWATSKSVPRASEPSQAGPSTGPSVPVPSPSISRSGPTRGSGSSSVPRIRDRRHRRVPLDELKKAPKRCRRCGETGCRGQQDVRTCTNREEGNEPCLMCGRRDCKQADGGRGKVCCYPEDLGRQGLV